MSNVRRRKEEMMHMPRAAENLLLLVVLCSGAIVGLAIGVLYFRKANRDAILWGRLLSSGFGPSIALVFAAAVWWPEQYRYQPQGVQAYYWLQLLPLFLLSYALAKYPGPRRAHWVLVPAGLLAWLWSFILGWLFIHGE